VTDAELLALAAAEAKKTSVTWQQWVKDCQKPNYDPTQAHWYRAGAALEQLKHPAPPPLPPPPPPPPGQSVFSGKGLFTTSDPGVALNRGASWVACQMDPEGAPMATGYYWMARPTQAIANQANSRNVPFIAQSENQAELDIALGLHLTVPKALVGNPSSWSQAGFNTAAAQGWDLILEWYANAHPWETSPNAHNYPRFVNVCFGIYSEGTPGTPSYVPQIPLSQYRAVWHGSFSCWKAEAMTAADWQTFSL